MREIELLAPAGNLERLQMACIYGADAVYLSGKEFGLRAFSENFTEEQLAGAISFAHQLHKKVYVTANIFANEDDIRRLPDFFRTLEKIGADAAIISDLGVFSIAKSAAPDLPIHVSTQANTCNHEAAKLWHSMGATRVILARELSLDDIRRIRDNTPEDLELEVFVHGAMCMSYSGRCLLSNFMTARGANHGECAQPCRWNYSVVEEQRPGQYMPLLEDERGSYVFNANDLCMIEHIPELIEAGVTSLKIEGRMKTVNYTATVTKQYRSAIDAYLSDPEGYQFDPYWLEELDKASHRPFSTGFYFGKPDQQSQCYDSSTYLRDYRFIGKVLECHPEKGMLLVEQRNHFQCGEAVELMPPKGHHVAFTIDQLFDEEMNPITAAPHPQQKVWLPCAYMVEPFSILRKK